MRIKDDFIKVLVTSFGQLLGNHPIIAETYLHSHHHRNITVFRGIEHLSVFTNNLSFQLLRHFSDSFGAGTFQAWS